MSRTLQAFAAHCARADLTKRPTVWVQFIDIWNKPVGEIGMPDPEDISQTAFALLSPWVIIPTLASAWLVVDWVDALGVVHLQATFNGIFNPHWRVDYGMDDAGALWFGEQVSEPAPPQIAGAVDAAIKARAKQTFWVEGHTIETVMPVVEGLLGR